MDIKQILQYRRNKKTRLNRPFANFGETFEQCLATSDLLIDSNIDPKASLLVERAVVISMVTAIEIYFREILDLIFRYCSPEFFEPHLKYLTPDKFDINDVINLYKNNIHPLEYVSSSQSFQNIDRIEKVFSKFIENGSFWGSILKLKIRIKDKADSEVEFIPEAYNALKRVFELRHELVHNPARHSFFSEDIKLDIIAAAVMILGSDCLLLQTIQKNKDPTIDIESNA